jgi:pimeloyl-ACP methyl ester carboxylesterase
MPSVEGAGMTDWSDGWWTAGDGLRLHYRDYEGGSDRPPIICIPGLTRNARDFEGVAERLGGDWRLICVELRGRGQSDYARDSMTYLPPVYWQDMEGLISALGLKRFALFGTSLGGLITMLLAMADNRRIAGALLNDIGPVLETEGLDHIRSYVGRSQSWPTWLHAARAICEMQRDRYPDWEIGQWLVYAKRLCKLSPEGRVVFDYDMRIAEPFRQPSGDTGFDLWNAFAGLKGVPSLVVHGELSDLLSRDTVERMLAENPAMEAATVPRVGHAPTLDEPEAAAAIDGLLARVFG